MTGLLLSCLLLVISAPAAHAGAETAPRQVQPEEVYFGALLDWAADSASGHAERLGAPAALYGRNVPLPMGGQDLSHLKAYFAQLSAQGSHALLSVEPRSALQDITPASAADFAGQIAAASAGFEGTVYVRFGPNMNAPWVPWGQQPEAYRAAFAAVASAARSAVPNSVMVWAPTAARDYPFREATPAPDGVPLESVDTNGDGLWSQDDAAYEPYYPGNEFVDWVGLSVYHDPVGEGAVKNTLPEEGGFVAALDSPGSAGVDDFYSVYGEDLGKPVMVETGALYSPGAPGDSWEDINSRWREQVFTAVGNGQRPAVSAVIWNESETVQQRGGESVLIDWRATTDPVMADAFLGRLEGSGLRMGPVFEPSQKGVPALEAPRDDSGVVLNGWAAWMVVATVLLSVLMLWAFSGRAARSGWAYGETGSRDARIDMLRGLAVVFVVVNHIGISSAFQLLTQETIGVVSGAELFVLFSGAVLGMVYGPRVRKELGKVVDGTSQRAGKLYATALVVALSVYGLSLLPFINATAITTFTDQGTGAGGVGTTYDLYAGMEGLLQFPVPQGLIPALLLLQVGPWQFNIMGLYVILLLVSPLVLMALARGYAWLVLAFSLVLYAAGSFFPIRLLPSQFEDSFPLLVWQVLFVVGMVAGYYRGPLVAWVSHRRQRIFLAFCLLAAGACALFSWTSPYLSSALDVRVALLPEQTFRSIYDGFFDRTYLGAGRLLNVLLVSVALYALLSAYWKPLEKALGWFLIPLGQATLYVFIMHVFLILGVANIPALRQGDLWLNTAAYVLVLGLLWTMVKTRFLFRFVPR